MYTLICYACRQLRNHYTNESIKSYTLCVNWELAIYLPIIGRCNCRSAYYIDVVWSVEDEVGILSVMLTMPRLRYSSGNMSIVNSRYIHLTGGCLSKNSCFVLTHFFPAVPTW